MLFNDTYQTINGTSEAIFRDKGSKFIAYAYPIQSESEIKELVAKLKGEHPKARHWCWALRLTPDRNVFKLNDDGEPSGTAGRPILNTLLSFDVTNIAVVVVRYFGGTLLGVPGLINAYKTATVEALNVAEIVEKTICDVYELQFDYILMNDVMRTVKDEQLNVLAQDFGLDCKLKIEIRKAELNRILDKLENIRGLKTQFLYTV